MREAVILASPNLTNNKLTSRFNNQGNTWASKKPAGLNNGWIRVGPPIHLFSSRPSSSNMGGNECLYCSLYASSGSGSDSSSYSYSYSACSDLSSVLNGCDSPSSTTNSSPLPSFLWLPPPLVVLFVASLSPDPSSSSGFNTNSGSPLRPR